MCAQPEKGKRKRKQQEVSGHTNSAGNDLLISPTHAMFSDFFFKLELRVRI
jgi:hypothetical protein